jgi:hypothetical protein
MAHHLLQPRHTPLHLFPKLTSLIAVKCLQKTLQL